MSSSTERQAALNEIERILVAHYLYLQRRRLFLLLRQRLEDVAYAH